MALVGRPKKENYQAAAQSLHDTLVAEGAATGLTERATPHIRGHFPSINVGAMHGKGTVNPINLSIKGKEDTVARLLKNPHVRQLAAFASCEFYSASTDHDGPEAYLRQTLCPYLHPNFTRRQDVSSTTCTTRRRASNAYSPPTLASFPPPLSTLAPTFGPTSTGTP